MTSPLEDSYIERAFSQFRARPNPAIPPYLLLVDCETRRFTIERPSTAGSFDQWCGEVEHAIAAGRHIVCVPIHDRSTNEIERLGASLGYAMWPARTILSPPALKDTEAAEHLSGKAMAAWPEEEKHKLRLQARVGMT
jgi:hypothetical protein